MANFTLSDLVLVLLTLPVWVIVFGAQGYGFGFWTNIGGFRRRCLIRQLGMASIFSLAALPYFYGLAALAGKFAVSALVLVLLLAACWAFFQNGAHKWRPRHLRLQLQACRYLIFAMLLWTVLALGMLLDVQLGDRLILSMETYDHSNLVAFTDAILRTGVPPANPCYFPGHSLPVFYHYYWVVYAAVISTLTGLVQNTRPVITAGLVWTGAIFILTITTASRYFCKRTAQSRLAPLCAVALLLVSNLYVLIVIPLCNFLGRQFCCMDWWTRDQMGSLFEVMLWCPHHVAGLTAGITGSMLLLQAGNCEQPRRRTALAVAAGCCLASQLGMSAYTAIGFGISWGVWMILSWARRHKSDADCALVACVTAVLISIPFLLQGLSGSGHQSVSALHLGIRRFEIIFVILPELQKLSNQMKDFIYFLVVPINYLFGWGFIMIGGILFWWRSRGQAIEQKQLLLLVLFVIGVLLGTFVRSSDYSNDFGWRTLLLGNLVLLIWASQYLAASLVSQSKWKLPLLCWLLIGIGLWSTEYSMSLDRTSMIALYDPARVMAFRQVYEEVSRRTPTLTTVQHNPKVNRTLVPDIFALLYSHRQSILSEDFHGLLSGDNLAEYDRTARDVESLFQHPDPQTALAICKRNHIDVIVVRDTDPLWGQRDSWLKDFPVLAANNFARAYLIQPKSFTKS
jgi:hypothetical protein